MADPRALGEPLLADPSSTASDVVLNTGSSDVSGINPAEVPRPSMVDKLKTKLGKENFVLIGGATQVYASVEQKSNLQNAQEERTKIYKDYIEYNTSYLTSMSFFVGCITTFGGLLTLVSYFGGMKSEKYFIINLVCLLGTFLFGFMGAALITYSHIRKLNWAKLSLRRRIFNLRNKVNLAPSTDALSMDEYEVQISELKASLGDERDFGMVAFILFCIAGFCMIIACLLGYI